MYQEVRINRSTEAGGGVDVGHLLAPLSHACYGPAENWFNDTIIPLL